MHGNVTKIKMLVGCLLIWWGSLCCGGAMTGAAAASASAQIDPGALSGKPVSRLGINVIGPEKDKSRWIEMAAALIELSEGDAFSPRLFQQSLEHLHACGRFAEVKADSRLENGTVVLCFELTVNRVIREIDIHIKGRDGVFEREILDVMSIYPGRTFSAQDAARQKEIITGLLNTRGFPAPEIEIKTHENQEDDTVLVRITVTLGPWKAVHAIHISGNTVFSGLRLKSRLKTWRKFLFYGSSTRLNERTLNQDIKALAEFYRRKGYPEATVDYTVIAAADDDHVSIRIKVDEGPRYRVTFSGNTRFSDRALKKELVIFSSGIQNGLGVWKSAKNIKNRYREDGYLKADVATEEKVRKTKNGTEKDLIFRVNEGRQTVVRSVNIPGNTDLTDKQIKKQMLTRPSSWTNDGAYVPRVLEADIRSIRRLYRENGFYYVDIEDKTSFSDDGTRADVVIDITEHHRVRVSSITFAGLTAVTKARALRSLRLAPGAVFEPETVLHDRTRLAALISETGRPHVQVESAVDMSEDGRTADIVYHIDEGPEVKMGRTFITGNLRTRPGVIKQEVELTEGDPFSLTKLVKSQQNLRSLQIFKSVDFTSPGLREQEDRVHLFIETLEKKPFFIELDAGYNSAQGGCVKLAAGDHNLLGFNRDGYISGRVSETGYRGDLGVRSPRFFFSRTSSVLNFYIEKTEAFNQDFGVRSRGASFGINRQWIPALSTSFSVDTENRRQYPLSASTPDDESYDRRHAVSLTPGIVYNTRDNSIIPTKGVMGSLHVTFSRGINSRPDDFIKYQGAIHFYHTLFKQITLAVTGRAGYIDPRNDSIAVVDDQLFFLGGISSVRGYAENLLLRDADDDPTGGRRSLSGTIEARIKVRKMLSLVLFYDAGKLDRTYTPADTEIRSSAGLGLGYRTPVGPLSLYYGHKLNRKSHESPGRFHFSIGYTF